MYNTFACVHTHTHTHTHTVIFSVLGTNLYAVEYPEYFRDLSTSLFTMFQVEFTINMCTNTNAARRETHNTIESGRVCVLESEQDRRLRERERV